MTTGTHNFVSFILSVAPVGALIAGLAGLSPCAATAACVVKHNFQTMLRQDLSHNQSNACLKFSKNCLNVLMEQQFQHFCFFPINIFIIVSISI